MKIIISKTYGGLEVPAMVLKKWFEPEAFLYKDLRVENVFKRPDDDDIIERRDKLYITSADFGETATQTQIQSSVLSKVDIGSIMENNRQNEKLIKIVEEYMKVVEFHQLIKVVEVPDDVDWDIADYDGMEWVEEIHRTWG